MKLRFGKCKGNYTKQSSHYFVYREDLYTYTRRKNRIGIQVLRTIYKQIGETYNGI